MGNACTGRQSVAEAKVKPPDNTDNQNDDMVWETKLPQYYQQIISQAVSPVTFSSKKQLYFSLCESILIDSGTKSIWVDRSSDKVGCMLSARALYIIWGDNARYWRWVSTDDSRFEEVAELQYVWWFEVGQRFECTLLSPNTEYSVSFVVKINKEKVTSHPTPFTFSLTTIDGDVKKSARFLHDLEKSVEPNEGLKMTPVKYGEQGWIEFIVGDFLVNENGAREIHFSMQNLDCRFGKSGISIDGVKITAKKRERLLYSEF